MRILFYIFLHQFNFRIFFGEDSRKSVTKHCAISIDFSPLCALYFPHFLAIDAYQNYRIPAYTYVVAN